MQEEKQPAFIYLASGSPRRQTLLEQIGVSFEVCVTDIDESRAINEQPLDYVQRMAREKALAALELMPARRAPVLAADTTVVLAGEIMGKPVDAEDARLMLERLSGGAHEVFTAVVVTDGQQEKIAVSRTVVTFREISAPEIGAYWDSGEPQGKAGSYAIQGLGAMFIRDIQGSYSGVMGLPVFETAQLLHDFGYRLL